MKTKISVHFKSVMLAVALATNIHEAFGADDLITLYHKAINYDADYLAALANTEADREEINKAKALFYPKAQLGLSRGRGITDRTTQTAVGALGTRLKYDTENYALSVRQPLFNKETLATYRSAKLYVSAQEEVLRQQVAKLNLKLTSTYLEVLYAKAKSALLKEKINAVTQQLKQAEKRFEKGAGTVVEINEAQTNLDIAKAEFILADNALADQLQTLANMTGDEQTPDARLQTEKLGSTIGANDNLDYWLESAQQLNPDVAAATYNIEVARQEIEKNRAGHFPTVDLVGVRSYSDSDSNNTLGSRFDSTTLAVQMNVPLFAGGYVSANVRQAQNKLAAAQESLNSKQREASAKVRKYYNGVQSALLSIAAYQQAVKSSEIAFSGTQKGFAAGFKTNIDVLNAQQKLFDNKLELTKSQYSLISDWVNLKYSAGMLDESELARISQLFMTAGNS